MPQIMVFGTSTEWGAWDKKGGWVDRLKQHCNQVQIKNPEKYCVVYNLGVSGDSSRELKERILNEFMARKDPAEKNIIIISVGGNDTAYFPNKDECLVPLEEYKSNLKKIITIAKLLAHSVYLLDLEPVDDARMNPCPWRKEICYKDSIVRKYNSALLEECARMKLKIIPTYEAWRKQDWKKLLHDGLHPNSKGHELTFKTVKKFLENEKILPR